jgi:hypothetical protein
LVEFCDRVAFEELGTVSLVTVFRSQVSKLVITGRGKAGTK